MTVAVGNVRPEWKRLLESYCRLIDARDFAGLERVFIDDCEIFYGDVPVRGLEALRDFLEGQFVRFESTRHTLGSVEAIDGVEGASGTMARIEAWHRFHPRSGERRPDLTLFGRFESRFIDTPDGWRIREHRGSEDDRSDGP